MTILLSKHLEKKLLRFEQILRLHLVKYIKIKFNKNAHIGFPNAFMWRSIRFDTHVQEVRKKKRKIFTIHFLMSE